MSEPPDIEDIARRYIELWEEQLTAMASDPDALQALSQMFAAANWMGNAMPGMAGQPGWMSGFPSAPVAGADRGSMGNLDAFRAAWVAAWPGASGAKTAAAASDDGGDPIREFECRLAAVEKRLAALEDDPPRQGGHSGRRGRSGSG